MQTLCCAAIMFFFFFSSHTNYRIDNITIMIPKDMLLQMDYLTANLSIQFADVALTITAYLNEST